MQTLPVHAGQVIPGRIRLLKPGGVYLGAERAVQQDVLGPLLLQKMGQVQDDSPG